jgi:nucleoside-diphosphate-sugar epimerase
VPTLSGGRTHAGLVYVDDVALAMMSLAEKGGGGDAYNVVDPEPISWRDYFAVLCAAMDIAPPRLDIPAGVAMGVARCSEALWRALRRETRPLFTRHVACVMSRDQHYSSDKLRRAVPEFPRIGLRRGLELTTAWLAAEPRSAR